MIDAGYFVKRIEPRPTSIEAPHVREICSVSHCISGGPHNWLDLWLHNGLGWCNRPADALGAIRDSPGSFRLFAYRLHAEAFSEQGRGSFVVPDDVRPEPIDDSFCRLGFDAVSGHLGVVLGFECSPLSCNYLASEIEVNEFCLFSDLEQAIVGAGRFAVEQPEPGDYYVVEVLEKQGAP